MNIYYGATERTVLETGQIGHERLRRIRSVHVTSPSCAVAERVLDEEHLVVLRGADGSGKRTTALFLLSELVGDDVHAVGAEVTLGSTDGFALRKGAGYLAESTAPAELAYTRLATLSSELVENGAYLVVTAPTGTSADADTTDRFIVNHEPPGCREVVRRHLCLDADHACEAERLLRDSKALPY